MLSPWPTRQATGLAQTRGLRRSDRPRPTGIGAHYLRLAGQRVAPAQLLGVELPPVDSPGDRLVEAYPRRRRFDCHLRRSRAAVISLADLLACVSPNDFLWRRLAIEAIVSVQTALLDSWPELTLHSFLPAAGVNLWRARALTTLVCDRIDRGPVAQTIASAEGWGCFGFDLPWHARLLCGDGPSELISCHRRSRMFKCHRSDRINDRHRTAALAVSRAAGKGSDLAISRACADFARAADKRYDRRYLAPFSDEGLPLTT